MMLTEEDAFEAEPVDALPVGEARVEERRGYLWRDVFTRAARRIQELENPRPDHAVPRGRGLASSCGSDPPWPNSPAKFPGQVPRPNSPAKFHVMSCGRNGLPNLR